MSFNPQEINAIMRARIIHSLDKVAPELSTRILRDVEACIADRDAYESQLSPAEWSRATEGRSR